MSIPYYYHNSFSEIPHKGKTGNEYVLDAFLKSKKIVEEINKEKLGTNLYVEPKRLPSLSQSVVVHDPEYIESLVSGEPISMAESSGVLFTLENDKAYVHMAEASYQAMIYAKENGFAYDLAGGNHHAGHFAGGGFCPIHSTMNAIARDFQKNGSHKVVIIDTDVHFGDGTASYLQIDPSFADVKTFDLYGYIIPKAKHASIESLNNGGNVIRKITHDTYFKELGKLDSFLKETSPDFVFWFQGADIWNQSAKSIKEEGLSAAEIYKRDTYILDTILKYKLPFVMSPGGGYLNYKDSTNKLLKEDVIEKQWQELMEIYIAPLRYVSKKISK